MGYTTDFYGQFDLNKKLDLLLHVYLKRFSEVRHMKRDPNKIAQLISLKRFKEYLTLFGGVGTEAEFFIDGKENYMGDDADPSVLDHNQPPSTQPSLWCQWLPSEDGLHIEWDGGEKFYEYVEWLQYICDNFLAPKGYILNGSVRYQGEDSDDAGWIVCENNQCRLSPGMLVPVEQSVTAEPEPAPAKKPRKPRLKKMTFSPVAKRVLNLDD